MSRFFISHSSKDAIAAHEVCRQLQEAGHQCWIAPDDIGYGELWPEEITKGLKDKSGVFLLLLSRRANESKQVTREVNMADNSNVKMLVFRLGDFTLNRALQFYLSMEQMYVCDQDAGVKSTEEIVGVLLHTDWTHLLFPARRRASILTAVKPPQDYVSREQEKDISRILEAGKICTLYGEGGMGKSSLAKSWYQNHQKAYKDILFLNAETLQDVMKSLCIMESEMMGDPKFILSSAIQAFMQSVLLNDEEKILILVDNLGYDRGTQFEEFESLMSEILTEFGAKKCADIIVTTRLTHVFYQHTEMIYVGDLTEDQAFEYLKKNFTLPFNAETARGLIHAYGILNDNTGLWSIPAISCVAIKNTAIQFGGYEHVNRLNGPAHGLVELVFALLEKLSMESARGKLFTKILKLASFLDGGSIDVDLLRELTKQYSGCTDEQFMDTLDFFDTRLTLLNYTDPKNRVDVTIHRRFQQVLNRLAVEERTSMKEAIICFFLTRVHPFSYYGTQTLEDPDAVMQHLLAFHEVVKTDINSNDYYRLLRAAAWYYGYVCYDWEISSELYNDICDPASHASNTEKQMSAIDRELVRIALRDHQDVGERLRAMRFGIGRLARQNKDNEARLMQIRYQIARVFYENLGGTLLSAREILAQAEKECQEMMLLFDDGDLSEEHMIFITESLTMLYCKQAELERKRSGTGNYEESLRYCGQAIACLDNEGYQWSLEQMGMSDAASYLRAFAFNLQGVAYNERNKSLQEQYEAERLNQAAKDEYLMIHYLPGIANQEINFVNIFRAQARHIIDAVNAFIRLKGEPASPLEWQKMYESEDIIPDLRDREGQEKSVKAWIQEFKEAVYQAKEQRNYSRNTRESYHTPLSEGHYMYMLPLVACELHYNAYSDEEKRSLLLHAFDEPGEPEGQDGLEKAMQIPGLNDDTASVIRRYQGMMQRHLLTYTTDPAERQDQYQKALDYFERSRELAMHTGNENALQKTALEQGVLEKVMGNEQ